VEGADIKGNNHESFCFIMSLFMHWKYLEQEAAKVGTMCRNLHSYFQVVYLAIKSVPRLHGVYGKRISANREIWGNGNWLGKPKLTEYNEFRYHFLYYKYRVNCPGIEIGPPTLNIITQELSFRSTLIYQSPLQISKQLTVWTLSDFSLHTLYTIFGSSFTDW